MTGTLKLMLTCHWSARRIQRFLDADPSAPLSPGEVTRLEAHLATCEKCNGVVIEHRALHRALSLWSGRAKVDPASVGRLQHFLYDITEGPTR